MDVLVCCLSVGILVSYESPTVVDMTCSVRQEARDEMTIAESLLLFSRLVGLENVWLLQCARKNMCTEKKCFTQEKKTVKPETIFLKQRYDLCSDLL